MSYLVLARKYRPKTFDDVIGQEDVVQKLSGALKSGRLGHAFLFSGPRGTGKTTCARILAAELNKIKKTTGETFEFDSSLDIIEIDGASNRGIDEIRTLRENVKFVPMSGSYKIYIVDEVHMLTGEAFNALLKTLEEPPEHVKFIFATTDPNKLPLTVISRCQRFDFRRIPFELIVKKMKSICKDENISADDDALYSIAKASQGSMRDALSILDQLSSTGSAHVTIKDVTAMFGLVETDLLFALSDSLADKNCSKAILTLNHIVAQGKDTKQLTMDLIEFYRHLMVMKAGGVELQGLIDYSKSYKEMLFAQAGKLTMLEVLKSIDTLIEAQDTARITESSRLALEVAFAKITLGGIKTLPVESVAPTSKPSVIVAPQARPVPSPVVPPPILKPASAGMLKSNKGSIFVEPVSSECECSSDISISLEDIQAAWDALTHAVSQKRISVGSYLQEGEPFKLTGNRITIAFGPEYAFHKEALDKPEYLNLMSDIFSEHFKVNVVVDLMIADVVVAAKPQESVQAALAMFQGEVVNEWHNEKAGS